MSKIQFDREEQGYNTEQIDRYIDKIEKEYKGLLTAYERLEKKFEDKKVELDEARKQVNGEAAAAVMLKAEVIARHTEKTARLKADTILAEARSSAGEIVAAAKNEAEEIRQSKEVIYAELLQLKQLLAYVTEGKSLSIPVTGHEVRRS